MTALQTLIQALREATSKIPKDYWYTEEGEAVGPFKKTAIRIDLDPQCTDEGTSDCSIELASFSDLESAEFSCLAANELPKLLKVIEIQNAALKEIYRAPTDVKNAVAVCGEALAKSEEFLK